MLQLAGDNSAMIGGSSSLYFDFGDPAPANGSTCDICTAILANATQICKAEEYLTPDAADCLDEDSGGGVFGSYLIFWRCTLSHAESSLSPWPFVLLLPWLLMLLTSLGSTADNFLMPQLHYISEMLHLSPDVAGVTFLAVGNGSPDVFSAIAIATTNLDTQMDLSFALSDIIGG